MSIASSIAADQNNEYAEVLKKKYKDNMIKAVMAVHNWDDKYLTEIPNFRDELADQLIYSYNRGAYYAIIEMQKMFVE